MGRRFFGLCGMRGAWSVRSRMSVLRWALAALLGGLWGASLGRLLFELFPLWFSWRYSSALVFGLACAILTPPAVRYASRREPPARLEVAAHSPRAACTARVADDLFSV